MFACWNPEDETFGGAFIDPGFELREGRRSAADAFVDLLLDYLNGSPLDESPATRIATHATDDLRDGWNTVEAEYGRIAEHYPSLGAFVVAMRSLVAVIRADSRFRDVDPRVARGDSRAGGPMMSLVFRLLESRSVWAWWSTIDATYHVALIESDAMLREARSANVAEVVELLLSYLESAA